MFKLDYKQHHMVVVELPKDLANPDDYVTELAYNDTFDSKEEAQEVADTLNVRIVNDLNTMDKPDSIVFIKCKDCGKYFFVTKQYVNRVKQHGHEVPKRCEKCRAERRNNTSGLKLRMRRKDK